MKMLIIEDDITVANFIKTGFEADSFTVDIALDGQQGSYIARTNHYDIIILDYSLPEKNGFTVLQEIRSKGQNTPIIFLSVIGDTNKKIRALQLGADDYLSKPFSFDELKARVRAIIRRPREIEESIIEMGNMKIDLDKHTVIRDDKIIHLTRKEYSLFEYLIRHRGQITSRGIIMEHVWNADSDPFSNTVEAHILNLRKKIHTEGEPDIIKNIPGRGYIIEI
jgi:DNA-binding response OmpR family regulator